MMKMKALIAAILILALIPSSLSQSNEFTVAFLGDLGLNPDSYKVNQMLKDSIDKGEIELIVLLGDLGYGDIDNGASPKQWADTFDSYVPKDFPVMNVIGNHEFYGCNKDNTYCESFHGENGYAQIVKDRFESIEGMNCTHDEDWGNFACNYNGIEFIGLDPSEPPFDDKHKAFLENALTNDNSTWQVCMWHKENGKVTSHKESYPNQVDIKLYDRCRREGAMIFNGHVHSYERTKVLYEFENIKIKSDDISDVHIGPGYTFSTIAGIGGRPFYHTNKCTGSVKCNEFAVIDSDNQKGKPGVLYITFNYQGSPGKAFAQFINIDGQIRDEYTITNDKVQSVEVGVPQEKGFFAKILDFFRNLFR